MSTVLYFTRRGLKKLQEEVHRLERKLREIQAQTGEAAETGGNQWHDNASYESLVIETRAVDRQLSDAHDALNRARIFDPPANFNKVTIGTNVRILKNGKEMLWKIVGYGESDPSQGMLAYNTPLALMIMRKEEGDVVSGTIAEQLVEIEILEIMAGEA